MDTDKTVEEVAPLAWPAGKPPSDWVGVVLGWFGFVGLVGGACTGIFVHWVWLGVPTAIWVCSVFIGPQMLRPTKEALQKQLGTRGRSVFALWGSTDRAKVAEGVEIIFFLEFGWRFGHFIPADPVEIISFETFSDGGEWMAIAYELEKKGYCREKLSPIVNCKTFGDIVDVCMAARGTGARLMQGNEHE